MVTKQEKNIYNTYLAITRSCRNKPFKIRENFDGFDDSKEHLATKRLIKLFNTYPQIKRKEFFEAPFKIYEEIDHLDISFYTKYKAISIYSSYMKTIQESSPDSPDNIEFILKSLTYIGKYCLDNKINIKDYCSYNNGVIYPWMKHVKEHNVSFYVLCYYYELVDIIKNTPTDLIDMFIGDIASNVGLYINKYKTSTKARSLIINGITKIDNFIKNRK